MPERRRYPAHLAAFLALVQWPLAALLLDRSDQGSLSALDATALLLTIGGAALWIAGCWRSPSMLFSQGGAFLATVGAYLCMRNVSLIGCLVVVAGYWLLTLLPLVSTKSGSGAGASILAMTLVVAWLALEALLSWISLGRSQPVAIATDLFEGKTEARDLEAVAQLVPLGSARALKVRSDEIVEFDVTYHTDRYGSRVVPNRPPEGPAWLLFGGSFTFGEGLEDGQTIASRLQESNPQARVFNFGIRSAATGDAYLHLKRRIEGGESLRWCVYFFISDHLRRVALPDWTVAEQGERPRFVVADGRPVLVGKAGETIGSHWSRLRINLVKRSRIAQLLLGRWSPSDESIELVAALSRAMDEETRRAGGRFLFVMLPLAPGFPEWPEAVAGLRDELEASGIRVLDGIERLHQSPSSTEDSASEYYFLDGHPNPKLARVIAAWVSERIREVESLDVAAVAPAVGTPGGSP